MAFSYLARERIAEIKQAFISARISYKESRDLLMEGITPLFVASLRTYSSDQNQLAGDLSSLNSVEKLTDDTVPLLIWLTNAADLFAPRTEASVFARAVADLPWRLGGVPQSAAVPAETDRLKEVSSGEKPAPSLGLGEGKPAPSLGSPKTWIDFRSEVQESLVTRVRNDIVNFGFAPEQVADKFLPKTQSLRCSESYYFWFNVGYSLEQSIGTGQSLQVENLPASVNLKVALFSFEGELAITPGQDVGEIRIERDTETQEAAAPVLSKVVVTRQPCGQEARAIHFSEAAPPDVLEHFLFFPVKTLEKDGPHRLRCNIYCGQVLVQSHLVTAYITRGPQQTAEQGLSAKVDYVLSQTLRPAHLAAIEAVPHRLSLMINSNGDGSNSFRFFGADGNEVYKNDAHIDGQQLEGFLTQARRALKRVSWGTEDEWDQGQKQKYRYTSETFDAGKLARDLAYLARAGWRIYAGFLDQMQVGREKLESIMADSGSVQIALKLSPRAVLPAAVIYDYRWIPKKYDDFSKTDFQLCPTFAEAIDKATDAEALLDAACFKGGCYLKGEIEKFTKTTLMDLPPIICPSGFWGYRHDLGFPLTMEGANAEVPPVINVADGLRFTAAVSMDPDFVKRDPHLDKLKVLRQHLTFERNNNYRDALKSLKAASPHLLYFYCHGGAIAESHLPFLELGEINKPDRIGPEELLAEGLSLKDSHPLVFINGCHTTALDPEITLDFVSYFIQQAGASGVIGTEITIFEELAVMFAEQFMARFLGTLSQDGVSLGRAVRVARLELLRRGNPLGLVYIPFAMAGVRLQQARKN
jgi:hypothetical protein